MKNCNRIIFIFLSVFLICLLTGCTENGSKGKNSESTNYNVVGIWKAEVEIHKDNPYNYGEDNYYYEFFLEFNLDGTMRNRGIIKYNGRLMSDTDWMNANATYIVENNVITISTGKSWVIINDEIHDMWTAQNLIVKYKKLN